jgi:hypothetical protein
MVQPIISSAPGRLVIHWRKARDQTALPLIAAHPILGTPRWDWWRTNEERPWGLALLILGQFGWIGFPDIHWQKIRTNNPLRIMKEIRRRTRVVGAFPDGQSCLNLAAARLRHIAGTTWSLNAT